MACKEIIHKDYFTLPQLSAFCGIGVRLLRSSLRDPVHPLPHYRINKKTILVGRDAFHRWLENFRWNRESQIEAIVGGVMAEMEKHKPKALDKSGKN